jgi:hypothetical protein
MKRLLVVLSIAILSGCAVIFPIPHDGAAFNNLVQVKVAVDKLNCENKDWLDAQNKITHLKVYTELRKDPQAYSVGQLGEAIEKAKQSNNKTFCESILRINKTRIDVIIDAWKGR